MKPRVSLVMCVTVLLAGGVLNAAADEVIAKVYLSNANDERYWVADLATTPIEQGFDYRVELNTNRLGDYFLSMRPFRCLENSGRMLCYLPYPYAKPEHFSAEDLRPLEYDFLFIQREAKDYGIDPWNGLYYKMAWRDGQLQGQAHAVDLNILAAPPDSGVQFPIGESDLHPVDEAQLWLPTLTLEGFKP